jgi:hypothetical protein
MGHDVYSDSEKAAMRKVKLVARDKAKAGKSAFQAPDKHQDDGKDEKHGKK